MCLTSPTPIYHKIIYFTTFETGCNITQFNNVKGLAHYRAKVCTRKKGNNSGTLLQLLWITFLYFKLFYILKFRYLANYLS